MKLFVYGTLKKGKCNHYKMHSASYLGEASIEGYQLHKCPAITPQEGGTVHGELYEIDDSLLASLDAFEGHNDKHPEHSLYRRTLVNGWWVYVYNHKCNYPVNPTGVY